MPNIRPVTDLKNYDDVLREISIGSPVFLTKNGRGRYAVVDIDEYERQRAETVLLAEIIKGESSAGKNGWLSEDEADALADEL